jgi:tetratricopeptide (TPR) repeat protein
MWEDAARLLSSEPARSHMIRGAAYQLLHQHDAAIQSLQRGARLDGNNPALLVSLGRAWLSANDAASAQPVLLRAVRLAPERGDAWLALGLAQHKLEDGAALASLERASQLNPDDAQAWLGLARAQIDQHQYDSALVSARRSMTLSSTAAAHATMAVVLHRKGERALAMRHARAAVSNGVDEPTMQQLMALIDDEDVG